jgi:lipid-binding SYLF domain-containing protein
MAVLALFAVVARPIAQEGVRESDRLKEAITVLDEVMGADDKAVPRSILERAEAIAVFPSLVKAGFVVGGSRGRGAISVRDPKTGAWSSPAFLTITGGSFGLQIGAQAVDLVLVVQNRRGLDQLLKNQFKIGADASVAAGPLGRDASASTDIQMRAQILSYSRTRGIFAGITLNGSTIRQDRDANERFYGIAYRTTQIVNQHLGGAPEPSGAWKATLAKYAGGTS